MADANGSGKVQCVAHSSEHGNGMGSCRVRGENETEQERIVHLEHEYMVWPYSLALHPSARRSADIASAAARVDDLQGTLRTLRNYSAIGGERMRGAEA